MNISSFQAIRYRGINGLSLNSLSRANLVTGVNGIGKTALLEAIWLFTRRHDAGLLWDPNVQRSDLRVADPIAELSGDSIELQGKENGKVRKWTAKFKPAREGEVVRNKFSMDYHDEQLLPVAGRLHTEIDGKSTDNGGPSWHHTGRGDVVVYRSPPVPSHQERVSIMEGTSWQHATSDAYLQHYSDMVREGHKPALTKELNLILPGVKDVEILTDKMGNAYLSANTSAGTRLPLQALGGGVVRLFRLYLNFFAARNGGMVLVDEIENGMHYSVLPDLWSLVQKVPHKFKWDVQFIATTHSGECVDAALEAFEDEPGDLSIHKLFTDESGSVRATTLTGEALKGVRDLDLEVR